MVAGNASATSSPAVPGTPTDLTAPAAPTGLVATRGDGEVALSWSASPEPDVAAYRLLRSVLQAAEEEELIERAPPKIRGAGSVPVRRVARPATLEEIAVIAETMPERLRVFVMLAAFVGFRQSELLELRNLRRLQRMFNLLPLPGVFLHLRLAKVPLLSRPKKLFHLLQRLSLLPCGRRHLRNLRPRRRQ